MVVGDMLDAYQLTNQTEEMISQLTENIQNLKLCSEKLDEFLGNDECSGEAFSAVGQQISDYKMLIDALKIEDEYLKNECYRLISLIGTEKLDGSSIIPKMETHEKKKNEAIDNFAKYTTKAANETNVFLKKFYEIEAAWAMSDMLHHSKLYEKQKEKADKFDEITRNTSSLFSNVSNIQVAIQKGLSDIATCFDGEKYKTNATAKWIDNLREVMKVNSNTSVLELSRSIVKVKDSNGKIWYGGNQNLLYDPKGDMTIDDAYMINSGCQLVALMMFKLYLEKKDEVSREGFNSIANQYLDDHFTLKTYYKKTHAGVKTNSGKKYNLTDDDLQMYVSSIARKNGYMFGAKWGETREIKLDDIKKQIAHDIPVMYHIGNDPNRPDLQMNLYTKDENGQFSIVTEIEEDPAETEVFNDIVDKEFAKAVEEKTGPAGLHQHFVVITGAEETINIDELKSDTMLKISSWGREYYFSYNEAVKYKEEILSGMSEEEAKQYCIGGLDNFSCVDF